MTPTGWNPAMNNATSVQNVVQQPNIPTSHSSSYSNGWYPTISPDYNPSLHSSSSSQSAGLSATIQRNHASNYVQSSFQSPSRAYSNSNGPIAITFRVLWGGPTTNLIMTRPSVSIMAPRTAFSILGSSSSTSSPSLLRDGDSSFATKLDETSSEYYYFQQLYLQDEQELGLHGESNDSKEMYILRLPFTYLRSLIESSSTKAGGTPITVPHWLDSGALRQQLTRSLYSYDSETSSNFNFMNNQSSSKDEMLVHQVAVFVEQSLSRLGDWYPPMSITNIMGLVLLSEGQLIMVARGNSAITMSNLLAPLNATRSISASSTSSSHITENSTKHLLNVSSAQTSLSPGSSYLGGGIMDTSAYSRGFGNFVGAIGRESDVDRNMNRLLPSYDNGWTAIGSDIRNMNIPFGVTESHAQSAGAPLAPSSNSIYGSYNLQEYGGTDTRPLSIQSKQSLLSSNYIAKTSSGQDVLNSGVAAAGNSTSANITLPVSRNNNTITSGDNQSTNPVSRPASSRPDPTAVFAALIALGFSQRQCEAAVLAVKNAETPPLRPTPQDINPPTLHLNTAAQHRFSEDGDAMTGNTHGPTNDDRSVIFRTSSNGIASADVLGPSKNVDVVSHADVSLVKGPVQASSTTAANAGQLHAIKMAKVLDIPQDMNAFIFHCNANTRDECLEKKMFGCPSGGQYGPHSKAKAGDLLFLADFSSWTVSGIFTAKCDAGLNLDPSAWGGKFPWQIRINEWTTLRTVHIDKVNEILGLAAGSKLNMLTKDQLIKLVHSKEFGPCVPSSVYKLKPAPVELMSFANALVPQNKEGVSTPPETSPKVTATLSPSDDREIRPVNTSGISNATTRQEPLTNATRPKLVQAVNSNDEHPSTAMHRSKLITAWFDTFSGEIVVLNELYNSKRAPQKKETKREKNISDDLSKLLKGECVEPWATLTFAHVRQAVVEIFYRWLLHAHAVGNEEGRNARMLNGMGKQNQNSPVAMSFDDSGSWLRQGRSSSSHGKKREDPVLITFVPGALEFVKGLLRNTGPKGIAIPTNDIAEAFASKFLQDLEQFAADIRKTQISSVRVGGDNYLKSTEDKTLSIRLSEVTSKYVDTDGVPQESTVMKVEWYTKASITQGRPPQVQKLDKQCFEMLEKSYRDVASGVDPEKTHFLTRLFVMLCRYELFGDALTCCQTPVPSHVFLKMCEDFGVTHECFTSPLSRICSSYNSIFPDTDRYFGSLGSFFDFMPTEGSFFVNPPFDSNIKMTFDHITALLQTTDSDKNALSFLVLVRNTPDLLMPLDHSPFLRKKIAVHFPDHCDGSTLGNYILIWLQNDFGHDLWTPTDARVTSLVNAFTLPSRN